MSRQEEGVMISRHAEGAHVPMNRPKWPSGPMRTARGVEAGGSEDWILEKVGTGRDVLLVGPDSARFATRLHARECRVKAVGCEPSRVAGLLPFCSDVTSEELEGPIFGRESGDQRFDVVVASELLDIADRPVGLLVSIRDVLNPGGYVVASRTLDAWREHPVPPTPGTICDDRGTGSLSGGSFLGVFEEAGYAVSDFRPMTLPGRVPGPEVGGPGSVGLGSIEGFAWADRSLVVAHPIRNLRPLSDDPKLRDLIAERDEARRKSAELSRELRAATVQAASLAGRQAISEAREEELQEQLLRVHEQVARGDDEIAETGRRLVQAASRIQELEAHCERLEAIIRDVAAHRDDLEARLLNFRRSFPGRIYRLARSLLPIGRR